MEKIDKIILGSNSFEGVGYLSRAQTRHYIEFFSKKENIIPILEASFNLGIRSFMCSNNSNILSSLEDFKNSSDLSILAVIPNAYEYARESTEKGVLGAILSKAKKIDLYRKVRMGLQAIRKIQGIITKDLLTILTNLMDFEMASFHSYNVPGVILHGQVTDLALSSHNREIFDVYQEIIRERYKAQPILATHNFGILLPKLMEWNIKLPIVASFNKKGFIMKPTQEECERLLEKTDYYIIAKKVMAGGRLSPEEAFPYLSDKNIGSVVLGIGSLSEAYHTLSVAKSAFQNS
ncbi:hypothetical protein AMJ44_05315 [candidate division WOR-1 bacterium DG_54_3]|uniref:Uncharacterized protein n=1 Tax=candidate division WOR-1 bacterium DG_54_3 TaxID=1703775 RepID=A0A0S7Y2M4_UNCSA|nr:MAG: hypothetical protein AMJ44_05315 [candidate division WOR-1 bacterium DG_54_3]